MNNQFEQFKALHNQDEPLLLGNVWDVKSALILQKAGVKAIGTSSAAAAETLGYKDGENMPFDEYLFMVKRIKASTAVPLSVDLETGYGKTDEAIVDNINRLYDAGVSGINIEDSILESSGRKMMNTEAFVSRLSYIMKELGLRKANVFINVRCDAFLLKLPDARKEAIKRITAYEKTGVHGIFLPFITAIDDITAAVGSTRLPVNVMCTQTLPSFDQLKTAGVKRISMGPFLNIAMYKKMEELTMNVIKDRNFSPLF